MDRLILRDRSQNFKSLPPQLRAWAAAGCPGRKAWEATWRELRGGGA